MTSEEIITRMGEIEQRAAEIEANLETPEADLDALNEEARKLVAERPSLKRSSRRCGPKPKRRRKNGKPSRKAPAKSKKIIRRRKK